MFAKRLKGIEPSGIRKVLELASLACDPVDMSIGQPDFDVPEEAKRMCADAIRDGFNRYTHSQGLPELREKVSERLRARGIRFEDVIITSGAAGALVLFFLALVEEGDEVVLTDPYFLNYRHLVSLSKGVPRFIDTYPDFHLREEEVNRAIGPSTRLIVLNSPGNPTGVVYTPEEIHMVVEAARRHGCWIISDEVYDQFVYDGRTTLSPAAIYDKALLVNSFSKSAGMPGWRLGYGTGPRELIQSIIPLQQYLYGCAPAPAQRAGLACLEMDTTPHRERMQRKRDLLYEGIRDCYRVNKPEGAFYMFPEAPGGDCYPFIERAIRHNLFVSHGDTFSRRRTHFRISYAVEEEALLRGIEILRKLAD